MAGEQITLTVRALDGHVADVVKRLAFEVVANLVAPPPQGGTPVDLGWARANWIPNIGSPRVDTAGDRPRAGSPRGGASQADQEAGLAGILRYTLDGGPVYITNNVPYIGFLNDGSSQQAPAGFVQAAVAAAVATVEGR